MSRYLPPKLPTYLLRLELEYGRKNRSLLRDLIYACKYAVEEDVEYDNWNGGTHGHEVKFFLPLDQLGQIDIDDLGDVSKQICQDLNKLGSSFSNEFFSAVILELDDDSDPVCQRALPFSRKPLVRADMVPFWKPGLARLFVSHRDEHKREAQQLAEALEGFGISAFVAHDTIRPMSEWRHEIQKGLETMEVMLVYLTDDFDRSIWTNQEVGFALGRGVPVISLKLGRKDPPGFISHVQALRGRVDELYAAARGLFPLIADALGRRDRLQER